MLSARDAYRAGAKVADPPRGTPLRAENYPAARKMARGECIHCHQIYEFRRAQRKAEGTWHRDERWLYPLPENIGLTLEVDRGDHVRAVAVGSPAERVGIRAGDRLREVNGYRVGSQADVQYGLHRGPAHGKLPLSWQRGGKILTGELPLSRGWKETNIAWRPSMLDVLPSLTVYGEDLTPAQKKAIGLPADRLAFRQDAMVHSRARAAGVQAGDVILGIQGEKQDMTMQQFLGHVRRNHLIGDRIILQVLRGGKRIDLPMVLK